MNLDRLYSDPDPHYELWLLSVIEEVRAVHEAEAAKMKKKG